MIGSSATNTPVRCCLSWSIYRRTNPGRLLRAAYGKVFRSILVGRLPEPGQEQVRVERTCHLPLGTGALISGRVVVTLRPLPSWAWRQTGRRLVCSF